MIQLRNMNNCPYSRLTLTNEKIEGKSPSYIVPIGTIYLGEVNPENSGCVCRFIDHR